MFVSFGVLDSPTLLKSLQLRQPRWSGDVLDLNITNWKIDCQCQIFLDRMPISIKIYYKVSYPYGVDSGRGATSVAPAFMSITQGADFTKRIRKGVLAISQLPDPIPGTTIYKPKVW
jgi:hypothetical protein